MEYAINQSKEEIKYVYSRLINKLDEHMKVLKDSDMPFLSYVGMKRELLKLNINYLSQNPIKRNNLTESEYLLINKILQNFQIDITEAISIGLVKERDMKKALILKTYDEMSRQGLKYCDIKKKLSSEYGVSVSAIEKMVYRR